MLIGAISKQSNLSRDTIRYYEKIGLLKIAKRQSLDNPYKNYPAEALLRLQQIQTLKQCGFTLHEIQTLLENSEQADACYGLPQRLLEKIGVIERKINELQSFKAALLQIHQACTGACDTSAGLPSCIEASNSPCC